MSEPTTVAGSDRPRRRVPVADARRTSRSLMPVAAVVALLVVCWRCRSTSTSSGCARLFAIAAHRRDRAQPARRHHRPALARARLLRRGRRLRLHLPSPRRHRAATATRRAGPAAARRAGPRRARSPASPGCCSARSPPGCAASTSASPRSAWSSSASTCCSTPSRLTGGFNGRDVPAVHALRLQLRRRCRRDPDRARRALRRRGELWYLGLASLRRRATWFAATSSAGGPGRALQTLRDSEVAAAVMGVDVPGYKADAFLVSSMYAGLGGVLLALVVRPHRPRVLRAVPSRSSSSP